MEFNVPLFEELESNHVKNLGKAQVVSPLSLAESLFTTDDDGILVFSDKRKSEFLVPKGMAAPFFEKAGPRKNIYFVPAKLTCAIVTCGGLCPGLNDVIRSVTFMLLEDYKVKSVLGFRHGYQGMGGNIDYPPVELNSEMIDEIQLKGGTILGSSRGQPGASKIVDHLVKYDVGLLFVVGGDGTFRGAEEITQEVQSRGLSIGIVGIPKTIDNDIFCTERTFGFGTSVEKAREVLASAHVEAKAVYNGVGLVKLMGRDSGFISASAAIANNDVNFCLIPEVPFKLDGENGFLKVLEKRLECKHHAVIVVSEGAGEDLLDGDNGKDASGNKIHGDVGLFLKDKIKQYFKERNSPLALKYIDPSYTVRSCPANAYDSMFCVILGQMAVHAGMAGKTGIFIGYWNHDFTHVPLSLASGRRKKVDPCGVLWQTVLTLTETGMTNEK